MELSLVSMLSIILFLLSAVYAHYYSRTRRGRLPPSPPGWWPVIGHLHLMTDMPHHALAEQARSMRAPLLHLWLGSVPAVVISKPDLARAALTTNDAALSSRPHLLSAELLAFGCSDVTLAPAGPYHRMARGLVVSELLSARRVATYGSIRAGELRRLLAHLAENTSPDTPVDLTRCLLNLANDVLCRVAFGRRFPHGHGKEDKLAAVLAEAQELFAGFTVGDFFPELEPVASTVTGLRRRLNKCYAELHAICKNIVDDHVVTAGAGGNRDEDFVDVLLRIQKSSELDVPLTDDNLMGIVLDMFMAGTDTTSSTMEWVMTELVRHPAILRKAQEEVRRVVGATKGRVEESDIRQLPYLRAVIKEAFRLHPPVPLLVPRESLTACSLGGYDIPPKTRVFINTFAIGRDPEIWENPLRYSPERWFQDGGNPPDLRDPLDFRVLPFGGGRRGCPGYAFAQATMEVTLASLLYHFEWALPAGVHAEDVSLQESFGLATKKKDPLLVVVTNNHQYRFNQGT